eukprot:g2672.t1
MSGRPSSSGGTGRASNQGGPTSTAPSRIPKKRPLTSSTGYGVSWKSREERLAEQQQGATSTRNVNFNDVTMQDTDDVLGLLNNTATGPATGTAGTVVKKKFTATVTGNVETPVETSSCTTATVEEQLITALKAKVSMLENQLEVVQGAGGPSSGPPGPSSIPAAAPPGAAGAGAAPTGTAVGCSSVGGVAARSEQLPTTSSASLPFDLKWAPAHTEKLVLALHSAEEKNQQQDAELSTKEKKITALQQEIDDFNTTIIPQKEKTLEAFKVQFASLQSQSDKDLKRIQDLVQNTQDAAKANTKLKAELSHLKVENSELTKRVTELQTDLDMQIVGKESLVNELQLQLADKTKKLSELELDKKELDCLVAEKDKQLTKLDAFQKALLMPASENILLQQLQELRKENNSSRNALQAKTSDLAELNDKLLRYEQFQKNQQAEIASLQQELQTKTELSQLLQQKNAILANDQLEKKQDKLLVEQYKAEVMAMTKNMGKMVELNDELSARLHSLYETVPAESVEAWLEPLRREKAEQAAVAET